MEAINSNSQEEKRKEPLSAVMRRHKGEQKAMKQRADRMKSSVSKKDKAGKARINEEIKQLYADMEKRHAQEVRNVKESEGETSLGKLIDNTSKLEIQETAMSSFYRGGKEAKLESKAARRRRRKAEKEAETQKQIEEERFKMGPSEREREMAKLIEQLKPRSLTIHEIKPDGHCMYSAVAHQLNLRKVNEEVEHSVQGLRDVTAHYMLKHKEDFLPFLDSVGGDEEAFKEYCKSISETAAWGGQLELRALSEVLRVVIDVYSSDMPLLTMGKVEDELPSLTLSYHRSYYGLGEHYNSVVPIE